MNSTCYLTEEHHMFRKAFQKFLEKEAVPYYAEWERMIPRQFWNKLGEQGYLCPWLDE